MNYPDEWKQNLPPLHPADLQRLEFPPIPQPPPMQPSMPQHLPLPMGRGMPVGQRMPLPARSVGGDLLLNVIFVGFFWEIWICLYPFSTLAGLLTLTNTIPILRSILPPSPIVAPGFFAVLLGIAASAVVLWNASRWEHVLARNHLYRIFRHLIRLPLLGFAAVVAIEEYHGLPYDPMPAAIRRILMVPQNLVLVLAAMVAAHFILWNWTRARNFWHRRLEGARLRKRA